MNPYIQISDTAQKYLYGGPLSFYDTYCYHGVSYLLLFRNSAMYSFLDTRS
jgi:hypothetical protein